MKKNKGCKCEIAIYDLHAWVKSCEGDFLCNGVYPSALAMCGQRRSPSTAEWEQRADRDGPCSYATIDVERVATLTGCPAAILDSIEAYVRDATHQHRCEVDGQIERGRRDWAAMSPDARAEMNEYAMSTEGHTID